MRRVAFRFVACAALIGVVSGAVRAQTFVNDDPVLKKIWDIGMNQSKTMDFAQVLFDSIGPRLYASPAAKASNDWIIKTYASFGVTAKQEPYGVWRGWDRGYTHMDLVKPRVRTLEALMLPWSPGTGGKDVVGPTILVPVLPDSAAFNAWLPNVKGKFVLMSAPKSSCRPHSEWVDVAPPEEVARLDSTNAALAAAFGERYGMGRGAARGGGAGGLSVNDRLEMAGAVGIITTSAVDGWGTYTVAQTRNRVAPAITMDCEDYGLLFRLTEKNQGPVIRLNAESKKLGNVPVYNTIATVPGKEKPNEYVMLSSHFDSWDAASGATDNGTGTVVMLEAMRILRQAYPNPKRTIISGHWVGEEEGLIGSQAYTADHPDIVKNLHALFNQDNGTGRIQSTSGAGMVAGAFHLQQWLSQLPREFQEQIRYSGVGGPARGGTDHASFDCYGSPAFGLSSVSWDYNPYTHHTNRDTYDKIVFDEVKGNATIVAMLVYLASEDPTFVSHERRNLNLPDPTAVARGGGGAGGGGGGRGGRGAPARGGGGRAAAPTDAMGWDLSCPKGPRASPDSARH